MAFLQFSFVFLSAASLIYGQKTCGSNGVSCLGLPTGCAAKNASSCEVLAKVDVDVQGDVINVELTALSLRTLKLSLANRWIAVGFSEDGTMSNSPVAVCFEQNGQAVSKLTFNSNQGKFNEGWENIDQSQLNVGKTSVDGNMLFCSASLKRKVTIKNLPVFDLAGLKHSLITATGPMVDGRIARHDIQPESSVPEFFLF